MLSPRVKNGRRQAPRSSEQTTRLQFETLEERNLLSIVYQPYGLDFSPYIAPGEDPNNGPGQITEQELSERIAAVAPYTTRLRTFGCTGDLAPASRIMHELGITTYVGAWISDDAASNQAEIDALVDQAKAGYVDVAIVGSEVLYRNNVPPATLIGYIDDVKTRLKEARVTIPVTTADIYSVLLANPDVVDAVEVVYVNYYPFWEGNSIDTAVARLHGWHKQMTDMARTKEVVVSETGWPSGGEPMGEAVPSPENAAYYFLNFVSWAWANDVKYFYFEAFDEGWKTGEGVRGTKWGVWDENQTLKPGMERVFNGERVPDNWSNPPGAPIVDFFAMPDTIDTNIGTFVVTGTTDRWDQVVKLNHNDNVNVIPSESRVFVDAVALSPESNTLVLTIESAAGEVVRTASKTVVFDPDLSTSGRRLLYIDAVAGESAVAPLDGTVVIDLDANAVLGLLPGRHVRGISPSGSEIYMEDRSVFSTATHQPLRALPFSQDIPVNGFLVSPTGDRLYSRNEVVNVQMNTLESPLPVDITTGSSYDYAPIPGGPAISADGRTIYANKPVVRIDTDNRTVVPTGIEGTRAFMSDIAISPDGSKLLLSGYSGNGSLDIYDASTEPLITSFGSGDFAGEIAFLDGGTKVVYGASGNPVLGGGGVGFVDLNGLNFINWVSIPLADNLTTSGEDNEVFVSSGQIDEFSRKRFGVDVLVIDSGGSLALHETIFLGINGVIATSGRPKNDQIGPIVFKPASTLSVEIAASSVPENAGPAATTATVTRTNVDLGQELTVTLSSSDTSEATVPATLIIPASQASATFDITAVDDSILDGTQTVTISASAVGFAAGNGTLDITDYETLTLAVAPTPISERAGKATVTVTRSNTDVEQALVVTLSSSSPTSVSLPPTVKIPANAESTPFDATGLDDPLRTRPETVKITASALGYVEGTCTVIVTEANDPPSFTKGPNQTVLEDAAAQTVADWATDISPGPVDESGQTVEFLLTNDNNDLFSVQPAITPDGTLTFTPAPNANGQAIVSMQLRDNGGTENGGEDTSAPQTFTITVMAVNDAPSFVKGPDQSVLEDAGPQCVPGWATAIVAGPANEASQTVQFLLTDDNCPLFSVQPSIAPDGTLTFTPALNANGQATVTVCLKDDGGTANGGKDTFVEVLGINVTSVNDPPAGTDTTVTTREDTPYTFAAGDFGFTDPLDNPPNAFHRVKITAIPAAGTLELNGVAVSPGDFVTVTDIDAGSLTFVPDGNVYGSPYASFTFQVEDDGGGENLDPSPNVLSINVTSVNDAPVLDPSVAMRLTPLDRGQTNNPGTLIRDVLASGVGGDPVTDIDMGAEEGIAVIGADTARGTWEISTDGGLIWTTPGTPRETSAWLLASDDLTRIRFAPSDAAFVGTVDPGITFRAWDQTFGTNGGIALTTPNGGETAFSTSVGTASITVNPVVQLPAGRGANSVVVSLIGQNLQVVNNKRKPPLLEVPLGSFTRLTIVGVADKADAVTVDLANMGALLPDGIVLEGGSGRKAVDKLTLRGPASGDTCALSAHPETSEVSKTSEVSARLGYAPSARTEPGAGTAAVDTLNIRFSGLEQLRFEGLAGNDTYAVSALPVSLTINDTGGVDTLDFSGATGGAGVNLTLAKSSAQKIFGGATTLTLKGKYENATGTPYADRITGSSAANLIRGLGGDDTLYGGAGDDTLFGGDGNDWLYGDAGNDVLYGELGNNLLLGGVGNDHLDVNLGVGSVATGRNLLIGGKGQDTLQGGSGEEILIGSTTKYDGKTAALDAILDEWSSDNKPEDRRKRLTDGITVPDNPRLGLIQLVQRDKSHRKGTILDDRTVDQFFGGPGDDWFFTFGSEIPNDG